jgi:hypothetical protein
VLPWIMLGLALAAAALWALGQWRWSSKTQVLMQRLEAVRSSSPPERFDPRELDGLPAPVPVICDRPCQRARRSSAPSTWRTPALST